MLLLMADRYATPGFSVPASPPPVILQNIPCSRNGMIIDTAELTKTSAQGQFLLVPPGGLFYNDSSSGNHYLPCVLSRASPRQQLPPSRPWPYQAN